MMFFRQESDFWPMRNYVRGCILTRPFLTMRYFSHPPPNHGYTVPEPALFDQIGKIGIAPNRRSFSTATSFPAPPAPGGYSHHAGHDHVRILNDGLTAWRRTERSCGARRTSLRANDL